MNNVPIKRKKMIKNLSRDERNTICGMHMCNTCPLSSKRDHLCIMVSKSLFKRYKNNKVTLEGEV